MKRIYKNVHIEPELWALWAKLMKKEGFGLSERLRGHIRNDIEKFSKRLRSSSMIASWLLRKKGSQKTMQISPLVISRKSEGILPNSEYKKILQDLELNGIITPVGKQIIVHDPVDAFDIRREIEGAQ